MIEKVLTEEEERIQILKATVLKKMREAELAMYNYARILPLGDERTRAFEVYENLRNAGRVHG